LYSIYLSHDPSRHYIHTLSLHDALPIYIRRHILDDLGTAANNRHFPHPAELMHCRQSPNDGIIFHHHMSRQGAIVAEDDMIADRDRKSTRLNSSHVSISYAVFCLKKKTQ